jgi:hypothetical protein
MTNEVRREWVRVNREYRKAADIIGRAIAHVTRTEGKNEDGDVIEFDSLRAIELLEKAGYRLDAEHTAERKRLDVGIYSPYGYRR